MTEPDGPTISAALPEEPNELADLMSNLVHQVSTEDILEDTESKIRNNSNSHESLNELRNICDSVTDENHSNVLYTIYGEKEDSTIQPVILPENNTFAHTLGSEYYEEDVKISAMEETASHASALMESCLDEISEVENSLGTHENCAMVTSRIPSPISSPFASPMKECPIECKRRKVEKEEAEDEIIYVSEGSQRALSKEPKPQHSLNLADTERTGIVTLRIPISIPPTVGVYSKVVTVLGVSWCLFYKENLDSVSLFLKCLEEEDAGFTCEASTIIYMMHHPFDAAQDVKRNAHHKFNARENDWGFQHFQKKNILSKYVDIDDTLLFSCQFTINYPQGVRWLNERTRFPIGLINQGATCYMNAALQIMFFTKCLSKAVLELDFKEDYSGVVKSLQKLFFKMHTSAEALSTEDLTNAFGWRNTDNTFTQHDVQEMMNMLLDKIEKAFKGTRFECMVDDLFKTTTRTFIRCLDVELESGRDDYCLDIQLPVQRQNGPDDSFDILTALREMTLTELMDGDNKYEAEGHGLQRAERGMKFVSFPKILHLQLLRFQMDWQRGEYVKVHNRVEFSDILDLEEFIEAGEDGTLHEYALHGVVCHKGTVARGHYVAFVCLYPGADHQKWFRFDDAVVTEVTKEEVMCEEHFGSGSDDSFSAYMLTYIRSDLLREVLEEFPLSIVSERLKREVEMERNMEKWQKIAEERGIFRFRFVKEPEHMSDRVWDHFDYVKWMNDPYRFKLDGEDVAIKLFHKAQEWTGQSDVRLFVLERTEKEKADVWRVKKELECGVIETQMGSVQSILGGGPMEYVIFIMSSKPLSLNQTEGNGRNKMIFIKWYDANAHSTRYVSPMKVSSCVSLSDMSECVSVATHLPPLSHIKFWKETCFDKLEEMASVNSIEVEMGDVVVFELVHLMRTEKTIQSILDDARQVNVSFKASKKRRCFGLITEEDNRIVPSITVLMTCTYRMLLELLSPLLDHSSEKIMLWVNGKTVGTHQLDDTIKSTLIHSLSNDPREDSKALIEFTRLSVTLTESLFHIGITAAVRISGNPYVLNTEYMTRNQCRVFSRFKIQLLEKYRNTGDMDRLRFVWRFRQDSGYFVFREMGSNENVLEMMDTMENNTRAIAGSLMVCVDEMNDDEMGDFCDDDIIVPLVFIKSQQVRKFTNEEKTFFIKIREGDDMSTIKSIIDAKCGEDSVNWENVDLVAYMGSACSLIDMSSPLGLNELYEGLREEQGLCASRPTRVFIGILIRETEAAEERVNGSIVIRD